MYSAHEQAWTKAGILHGDISDNNIMVVWRGDVMMGILVDWDLCKSEDILKEPRARNGNQSVGFISYSSLCSLTTICAGNMAVYLCASTTISQKASTPI